MRHILLFFLLAAPLVSCTGCDPSLSLTSVNRLSDSVPPSLLASKMTSGDKAELTFDEPLSKHCSFDQDGVQAQINGSALLVTLPAPLGAGSPYTLSGRVKDQAGNSTRFTAVLWGVNLHPATVLITQVSTKGTKTQPDRVELLVTKSGSMAGLTLQNGAEDLFTDRYVFPDEYAWKDSRYVVQFQKADEYLERTSEQLAGLGGDNGVLVLLDSPRRGAALLDALVWSDRESSAADGWGTEKVKASVEWIAAQGGWESTNVEDSIDSRQATSTRPFVRNGSKDTNRKDDWKTAPKGGATWGR